MGTGALQKRFSHMPFRTIALSAIPVIALLLAGCERKEPQPQPAESPTAAASSPAAAPSPEAAAPPSVEPAVKLDLAALEDRAHPDRLLRFYAAALHARDWSAASRAWGAASGVTAATLKAAYDRADRPVLEIGKAEAEGAAGSLYYEAPVVLRFGADAPPERGTLTLRRVNDVDGATPEQLRWHIERATIGVGQ
jgi:hypothetical protein